MGKYGKVAILATDFYRNGIASTLENAWDEATARVFPLNLSSQIKGCPRNAYLGLCESGLISGIPQGHYCKSHKNKEYAIKAVDLLRKEPGLSHSEKRLWNRVMEGTQKTPNNQMDVVISLWNAELILR